MSEQPRISYSGGKGKLRHNNRNIISSNVDLNRVKDNITFISLPVRVAYDKIFKEAQEEYDAKQKRNDRKIHNYFDKLFGDQPHADDLIVQNSNKQKSFYEYVVGIGDKDTMGYATNPEGAAIAEKILQEYAEGFQQRNPNFFVFNSVMHRDEATPHLHFDYIPYTDNCKKGMRRQQGIARALEEMGYGIGDHASARFVQAERKVFREICERHGITPAEEKESRGYTFTVEEYRKHQDKIAEYEEKEAELEQNHANIEAKTDKAEKKLKEIEYQYDVEAQELREVLNKKARASEIKMSIFDRETQTYHKNMLEQTRAIGNEAYKDLTEANDKIKEAAYIQAKTETEKKELLELKKELKALEIRLNAKDAELKKQQSEIEKEIETKSKKLLEEKLTEMFGTVRTSREKRLEIFANKYADSDGKTLMDVFLERENKLKKKIGEKSYEQLGLVRSDYTCFYYPDAQKMNYVIAQLNKQQIPYIETSTGFDIKNQYRDNVKEIEKKYKKSYEENHEFLKEDIDYASINSKNLEEFCANMEKLKYKITKDKYIYISRNDKDIPIRMNSISEFYTEMALTNRIVSNSSKEAQFKEIFNRLEGNDTFERMNVQEICVYIELVRKRRIPMRKRNQEKPFSWKNDAVLDKLTELNTRLNKGATLDTFKREFEDADYDVKKLEESLKNKKSLLEYYTELKEKIEVVFTGKPASEATKMQYKQDLNSFDDLSINEKNYTGIYKLISDTQNSIKAIEDNLNDKRNQLKNTADYYEFARKVANGTYVQSLYQSELIKKEEEHNHNSDFILSR